MHVATSSRFATTSTIVERDGRALLVDPAWSPAELDALAAWLAERHLAVTAGFVTHFHHDHVLWHPAFGAAPRWASATTVDLVQAHRVELLAALGEEFDAWPYPVLDGLQPLVDGTLPNPFGDHAAAGESLSLVTHDAHAPGHTAVLLDERSVLLAGDMLSDVELPLPAHADDLARYAQALDSLAPLVASAAVLVPGHGSPTDRPTERLDADRRYLDGVLSGGNPDDPRRANPDMEATHQQLRQWAREMR